MAHLRGNELKVSGCMSDNLVYISSTLASSMQGTFDAIQLGHPIFFESMLRKLGDVKLIESRDVI